MEKEKNMKLVKKRSYLIGILLTIVFSCLLFSNLASAQYWGVPSPVWFGAPWFSANSPAALPPGLSQLAPPIFPGQAVSPFSPFAAPVAAISALTLTLPGLPGLPTPTPTPSTSIPSSIPSSSSGAVAPVITNWSGIWASLLSTSQLGPMNLTLSQNTVTGAVTGTASLFLNKLIPLPVTVSGVFLGGTSFTVTGVYTSFSLALSGLIIVPTNYTLSLTCTLTSPTTMNGTYSILSIKETDFGGFNLTLI